MFQPIENVAECVLIHRYSGATEPYDNVLHFKLDGPWDAGTIEDLANEANAAWSSELASLCPSTASLVEVRTRDLTTEDGVRFVLSESVVGTGDDVDWLPPNCSTGVLFRCGGVGFPRHGYAFWPFVLEADCDRVGTLSGAALTVPGAFGSFASAVTTAISGLTHVVPSRTETIDNPTPPPDRIRVDRDPVLTNAVTSYAIGNGGFVSSQRDRRPRAT